MEDDSASALASRIHELRSLPSGVHWFCPRQYDGDLTSFPEGGGIQDPSGGKDIKPDLQQLRQIEAASRRTDTAISCLRVLAVQTEDMAAFAEWYKTELGEQMTKCDICVRVYHQKKKRYLETLRGEHDDDEVAVFARVLGEAELSRIRTGLLAATNALRRILAPQRGLSVIGGSSLFALFEALSSEAVLTDQSFMEQYLDEPFRLVQTNRPLKLNDYVPAMGQFLFDHDQTRASWATRSWTRMKRRPSKDEFWWVVQDPLLDAMRRAATPGQDSQSLEGFWCGVKLIVDKLDKSLITHCLRALEIDIYRIVLDHLQLDSPVFRHILQTFETFLVKSPEDFWDAMGAISPASIVEVICNSPRFGRAMMDTKMDQPYESSPLKDMLSWIEPFMASLKPANQPPACRALAAQLMERLQVDSFPEQARMHCFRSGLQALSRTLRNFVDKKSTVEGSVDRVVISEIMVVVAKHINHVLAVAHLPPQDHFTRSFANIGMDVVRNALALDCQCFKIDHDTLEKGSTLHNGNDSYSQKIWKSVSNALSRNRISLASNTLIGMIGQVGIEKFKVDSEDPLVMEKTQFDEKYGQLLESVASIFDRLSDFDPEVLAHLFQKLDTASALVAGLLAADETVYAAAIEIIKIVSTQSARREALAYLLRSYFEITTSSITWTIRRIVQRQIFAANPRMLKTCRDVLDILCDSQDGVLITKSLSRQEANIAQGYWQFQWSALAVIFRKTEGWGRANDKSVMKEFCRDTTQFAEKLFDQYSIFANAIDSAMKVQGDVGDSTRKFVASGRDLLEQPTSTIGAMARWLRLRDEFLLEPLTSLLCKILRRLGEWGMSITDETLLYIEDISVRGAVKTMLSPQQKAQLNKALDDHLGRHDSPATSVSQEPLTAAKQTTLPDWKQAVGEDQKARPQTSGSKPAVGIIDLEKWRSQAKTEPKPIEILDDGAELLQCYRDNEILAASQSVERFRSQQLIAKPMSAANSLLRKANAKSAASAAAAAQAQKSFKEKREKERREKMLRDQEQIARLKRTSGTPVFDSVGVQGKEKPLQGASIMVSSASESDESEDELDRELFGIEKPTKASESVQQYQESKRLALSQAQARRPVKKVRQIRNARDMRARLAPDLSPLHRTILSWDFFHKNEFPPQSDRQNYTLVSSTFRTPNEYQATFQPLLLLEAWQGLVKAREETNWKAFDIKVASRMTVDAFIEVGSSMPLGSGRDLAIGEADIILMSKAHSPTEEPDQPHCLARVTKVARKKTGMEITYRLSTNSPLLSSLTPNSTVRGVKVDSITPLEREYGALLGLQYYDLCDEIIKAKPSPLLKYSDQQLAPITENYSLNLAQSKAVRSAMDNDAFTLIQGPPGSGKTKTIVAIVGALLTNSILDRGVPVSRPKAHDSSSSPVGQHPPKKLLVCAPSNAAVDELVMRIKDGVKTLKGEFRKVSVVRLGRSDAINANVMDLTLDELVTKKLNMANGQKTNFGEEIHKLVEESKALSESLHLTRLQIDEARNKGQDSEGFGRELDLQKKRKHQIGLKIDDLRDKSSTATRDAEIGRKRAQQEILDGAHVICATLSGSGHEMFQNLSIEFEAVIIDEAAQSIELSALIPLKYGCSKCILVGDPKQLPPTVLSREAARFSYEQSLFVRMQSNHPNDVHLLDTQYRMHPEISQFPSKAFYDGKLLDGDNMESNRQRPWHESSLLGPYRFFDVQGQHRSAAKGHSLINVAELNTALQLFERLTTDYQAYDFKGQVAIITPYKGQLTELKLRFSQRYGESILKTVEFNTTDAFQGRENEIIIFSCVRASTSRGIGFLDDIRRMNVGLTRAKSSLWVLGNSDSLLRNEFWGRLIDDARQRDRYTTGDLTTLLRKPTVEHPSSFSIATKATSIATVNQDVEMIDAPDIDTVASAAEESRTRKGDSSDSKGQAGMKPPQTAGGRWGLDSTKSCHYCGSSAHLGKNCDNAAAIVAGEHTCYRCGGLDHEMARCAAALCTLCGEVGHTKPACVSRNPLSKAEQDGLQRKERLLELQKQSFLIKQKNRQLGEHDPRVPRVRTTKKTPPLDERGTAGKGNQRGKPSKRKREPSPLMKGLPLRPVSGISRDPHQDLKRAGEIDSFINVPTGPANATNGSRPLNLPPRPPSTNVTNGPRPSNLPPRPLPPRKKKEVDPFIRPNRKKGRS